MNISAPFTHIVLTGIPLYVLRNHPISMHDISPPVSIIILHSNPFITTSAVGFSPNKWFLLHNTSAIPLLRLDRGSSINITNHFPYLVLYADYDLDIYTNPTIDLYTDPDLYTDLALYTEPDIYTDLNLYTRYTVPLYGPITHISNNLSDCLIHYLLYHIPYH